MLAVSIAYFMPRRTLLICCSKHVMRDLRPYVCLSPDCISPNQTFTRRQDWADDEFFFHLVQTSQVCKVCSENVQDLNTLRVHLIESHGIQPGIQQINSALESLKRSPPIIKEERVCPFCSKKLSMQGNAYSSHTARHLRVISLSALPDSVIGDNDITDDIGLLHGSLKDAPRKSRKTLRKNRSK